MRLEVPPGAPSVPGGFSTSGLIAAGAAGAAVAGGATAAAAGGGIPAAVLIGGGLAAAGAGVVVATRAGGGGGTTYEGPFNGQLSITLLYPVPDAGGSRVVCTGTTALAGTVTVMLDQTSGAVNGTIETSGTQANSGGCPPGLSPLWGAPLTGTTDRLAALSVQTSPPAPGRTVTVVTTFEFSGTLSGGVITGTLTFSVSEDGVGNDGVRISGGGSMAIPVTLQQR